MNSFPHSGCRAWATLGLLCLSASVQAAPKPDKDSVRTDSATLAGLYEDPGQNPPNFGAISYFNQPWRGYMDTWPGAIWKDAVGATVTGDEKYLEASATILREAGVHFARIEIGWNNLNWDEQISPNQRERLTRIFGVYRKNGIRPLILLNAHHGVPVPICDVPAKLMQSAKKGERTVQLAPGTALRTGTTGFRDLADYKAAFPLITSVAPDGLALLSAPLPADIPAGDVSLQELKYQPFQGTQLSDGTPVPAALETLDGWRKYAAAVGDLARGALGTPGDSGFDIEVWNEQTFGSDFLDIGNYYEPKREYLQKLEVHKTRVWTSAMRPDAQLEFEQKGFEAILPATVDFFADPKNGFQNVRVNSGFSNQHPFASGEKMWDGQNGLNKHYYTSSELKIVSPETPLDGRDHGTYDALNHFDGKQIGNEWWSIVPGSNFVPRLSIAFPEWTHSGFKTETLERDTFPDSRRANTPGWMGPFGRYTHNGDFKTPHFWQTEVNFDRSSWNRELMKQSGVKPDNARLKLFNDAVNSKMLLRQAVFHLHKGIERMFFFSTDFNYAEIGLFPPDFFRELDKTGGKLSPAARAVLPVWPKAFARMTDALQSAPIQAPRQLRVDSLVEHAPRLVFKGDGTPAHPSRFNRDFFAFLPFQTSAQKFVVPFYVVTPDVRHDYNPQLDLLDPKRYDLPPQLFDVTVGNVAGTGAKVSALDPLSGQSVPVQTLGSTASTLTVRLPTTDAPRLLTIEEAAPGIQILGAKIEAPRAGGAVLSWKLNRPAQAVRVSYGGDWTTRGANEITIQSAPNQTSFRVELPAEGAEMVAARIRVAAQGLSAVWPRWDEDPQGQVTMSGVKPHPRGAAPARPLPILGVPVALTAPKNVALPLQENHPALGFSLRLPSGARASGADDDRTITFGRGEDVVTIRARFLPDIAKRAAEFLPFGSATDQFETRAVTLVGARGVAVLSDYTLAPSAYPGVSDTRRRYLQLPLGKESADLLIVSASGTPAAMQAQKVTIEAIFASIVAQF